MPIYRVYIDGKDTGEFVTASSQQDAYFDVASTVPLTYENKVTFEKIDSAEAKPGFPVGHRTIESAELSALEQDLYIDKPAE